MSMTDPISAMLTQVRNAVLVRHDRTELPASRTKTEIAKILEREGFIRGYKTVPGATQDVLRIYLKYSDDGQSAIHGIKRVSKPGGRVYRGSDNLPKVRNELGVAIISTNRGFLTDAQARQQRVGGEVICEIW